MNPISGKRTAVPITTLSKIILLLIPILLIFVFAALFTNIFIVLVISILIALVLNPLVDRLESVGLNRSFSILAVYLIVAFALAIIFQLVIPDITNQAKSLTHSFKEFNFDDKMKDVSAWLEKNVPFLKKGDIARELEAAVKGSMSRVQDLASGVLSTVFFIILIPVITFFILRDRQGIKKGFISLVPNRYFEMTINIIDKIEKQLSRYVRGWLFDAAFLGTLSIIGLSILGIHDAILIGIIAGIGHLIPYAGPIIGSVPAILVSVVQFGDFRMVIPIVLMFTVVYLLDNSIAQPYIFSKSAGMNPITIIALILVGNQLLGPFGALIAIPIATVLKVSARETINGIRNYKLGYY